MATKVLPTIVFCSYLVSHQRLNHVWKDGKSKILIVEPKSSLLEEGYGLSALLLISIGQKKKKLAIEGRSVICILPD